MGKLKAQPEYLIPGYNRADEFTPFREYLRRSKRRTKQVSISLRDLKDQWEKQEGICLITGNPMFHPEKGENHGSTASLDRIDSSIGYVPGNIRFVCMWANIARRHEDDRELIAWCKMVVEHADRHVADLREFVNYD
jgi:hypothetical protein